MNIKLISEDFVQPNATNKVIQTANAFIQNTVTVMDKSTGLTVNSKELSNGLIKLLENVDEGRRLIVTYNMQVIGYNPDVDILKEIRKLQERVATLEAQQELLLEALQERVPLKTFKQWISLMEKNYGKAVLDENSLMGIQGASLP